VNEPVWIEKMTVLLAHAEALAEHGGLEGIRDEGLLHSALARPKNVFSYEETPDLPKLAAYYACGIVHNHPFVDGNKRAGFIIAASFLALNGIRLRADQVEAAKTFFAVAAGEIDEDMLAHWIKEHSILAKER
jgi:death-on-curing protein